MYSIQHLFVDCSEREQQEPGRKRQVAEPDGHHVREQEERPRQGREQDRRVGAHRHRDLDALPAVLRVGGDGRVRGGGRIGLLRPLKYILFSFPTFAPGFPSEQNLGSYLIIFCKSFVVRLARRQKHCSCNLNTRVFNHRRIYTTFCILTKRKKKSSQKCSYQTAAYAAMAGLFPNGRKSQ